MNVLCNSKLRKTAEIYCNLGGCTSSICELHIMKYLQLRTVSLMSYCATELSSYMHSMKVIEAVNMKSNATFHTLLPGILASCHSVHNGVEFGCQ